MNALPSAILFTRDEDLASRFTGALQSAARLHTVGTTPQWQQLHRQYGPSVVLLDLRGPREHGEAAALMTVAADCVFIVLGEDRSDPLIEAEQGGVYAALPLDTDARTLRQTVRRAFDHLQLSQQLELSRAEAMQPAAPPQQQRERATQPQQLRQLSRALRHFDRPDLMLESILEGVAGIAGATRAGIFSAARAGGPYRLRASFQCLSGIEKLEYAADTALVGWLERRAQLVCSLTLAHVVDHASRRMLSETLELLSAEVIAPLHGRGRLLGWLFVGPRATGLPYTLDDLEEISNAVEHASTALENALLHEEVRLEKSLAETLLHALPTGVVAADAGGIVRWFSTAAESILQITAARALNQPVEFLGSRLADFLRRALRGESTELPQAWTDPLTKRALSVQARPLGADGTRLGAVVLIQDITLQRQMQDKQEQLERAAFWNELAASMSHEVRNPLVTIKTFAQLLPERYEDKEFRADFSVLVVREVERLNSIIEQIQNFAQPPTLRFGRVDARQLIRQALDETLPEQQRQKVRLALKLDENLPTVRGDSKALATALGHVIRNAAEALDNHPDPEIQISAAVADGRDQVAITIRDNGHGIAPDIRDKIFSPFCTTKPRGMGLGLPIAQRTVADHNGRIALDSGPRGTSITLTLPVATMELPA